MWKALRSGGRALTRLENCQTISRTFLSEAYPCTEAWRKRFESPLLSKINPRDLFIELDRKFQNAGKASALDVDIFANVITDPSHMDELIDILHKLRLTPEASNILDSTHHAVIRYLFDNNEIENLLSILHDRINYGVFPDYLSYNMLMDAFLKRGDAASAAKVGVLLMLQEDSDNPLSNALAVYSCHRYLEKPEDWKAPEPEPPEDPKGEEIKVRVHFIRNPYFDDHFDLRDPEDLVGKTLVFYGKITDDSAGRSWHARGLVLWKKWKAAADLLARWKSEQQSDCIYAETLTAIRNRLATVPEEQSNEDFRALQALVDSFDEKNLKKGSLMEDIESRVHAAVQARAEADMAEAREAFDEWEKQRVTLLEAQLAELDRKERLERVDEMKAELASRERLLTYFDNRHKIELQIEEKTIRDTKMYGKRRAKSVDIDENYVPPEVGTVRRNNL